MTMINNEITRIIYKNDIYFYEGGYTTHNGEVATLAFSYSPGSCVGLKLVWPIQFQKDNQAILALERAEQLNSVTTIGESICL